MDQAGKDGNLNFEKLGSVETIQDQCIAFPNTNQHRMKHFFPLDPTKPASEISRVLSGCEY